MGFWRLEGKYFRWTCIFNKCSINSDTFGPVSFLPALLRKPLCTCTSDTYLCKFQWFLSHCPFFMIKCKVQCSALLTRWENNCLMFYMFASPAPDGQSVDFAICFQTQKISWSRVSYKLLIVYSLCQLATLFITEQQTSGRHSLLYNAWQFPWYLTNNPKRLQSQTFTSYQCRKPLLCLSSSRLPQPAAKIHTVYLCLVQFNWGGNKNKPALSK